MISSIVPTLSCLSIAQQRRTVRNFSENKEKKADRGLARLEENGRGGFLLDQLSKAEAVFPRIPLYDSRLGVGSRKMCV